MGLSLKKIVRAIGEPFEAIGKFFGHSAKEVGKFIGKYPYAVPLLAAVYPPAGSFLSSLPVVGDIYKVLFPTLGTGQEGSVSLPATAEAGKLMQLTQPSQKFNLQQFLPFILLSKNPQQAATALLLPQVLSKADLSTPQGAFTTMLMLSALTGSGSQPITPQVFSPMTPEQLELLQKAIGYITPPTVAINPNVTPTVQNPFAPFVNM